MCSWRQVERQGRVHQDVALFCGQSLQTVSDGAFPGEALILCDWMGGWLIGWLTFLPPHPQALFIMLPKA
jgi:hypothetical protein